MDRDYFLNAGLTPPPPSPMPAWRSLNISPEITPRPEQLSDRFHQPNWEKSTDQYTQFDSALSSMASSPVASNSAVSNDSFVIRELIGKLGNICNPGDISPQFLAAMSGGGRNSANTSCYSTPLNSPPKIGMPIMDQFIKENVPNLGNSMPLNPVLPSLSTDPGFAERAAKFSCFGSRSFNGRNSQLGTNNPEFQFRSSFPVIANSRLPRVSSSPMMMNINGNGSAATMAVQENINSQIEIGSGNGSILGSDNMGSDKNQSKLSDSTANSNEESSVSEQIPVGETGLRVQNESNSRKRKAAARGKAKENASTKKEMEAIEDSNAKRLKNEEDNGGVKTEEGGNGNGGEEESKKPEPPKDYIHVRARRGQATDSHSLAERVRREKIGERMKLLQDLVPGCNKVTGKALMLDEIINYVQSLQRQVEFLSMKLATVNPRLDFDMNNIISKDVNQSNGNLAHQMYPMESSASAFHGQQQPQQNTQVHNNMFNGSMDPMTSVHGFGEALPQFAAFSEDDLQSIVQMGFCDNLNRDTQFNSQSFHGDQNQTSHMKLEL